MDALINGKIPVKFLDIQIDKLFRYNRHEGFRLGLGLNTNDKFSRYLRLGGYSAYGFRQKEINYGGNIDLVIDRFREMKMSFSFMDDLDEAGTNDPFMSSRMIDSWQLRHLVIRKMDRTVNRQVSFGSRIFNYARAEVSFNRSFIVPRYDYSYITKRSGDISVSTDHFNFTEIGLTVRYAYGEKFVKNARSLVSMGGADPEVFVYAGHGYKGFAGGEYEFNRILVKVRKSFSYKYFGKTSLTFFSGMTDRDLPYCYLFNTLSNFGKFSFYAPQSFATMRMNEFAADRFAAIFLTHSFGTLLYKSEHFRPIPELVTNFGIGTVTHPENHQGLEVKGYEKGYFESGLVINNLLSMSFIRFGLGVFYRYGYYAFPGWKDNVALKLSLVFSSE
jgi:hypothetical protein